MDADLREEISAVAKILGILFYHSPENGAAKEIMALFSNESFADEWPAPAGGAFGLIRQGVSRADVLGKVFHELFIGPGENYTPHWASVFLDEKNLMNGESTMALKNFLRKSGIKTETGLNEPADQIGIMFFIASTLAESADEARLGEFLNEYMHPWCYRYFDLLEEKTDNSFYKGLAQLGAATASYWSAKLKLSPKNKKLYL